MLRSAQNTTDSRSENQHRPQRLMFGTLELPSRYLLSPLAGFTNLSFRRICRELGGVGLCTTDLVSARGLLERSPKSMQLIESCAEDTPYSVQIFGPDRVEMCDAARFVQEYGADSVDINMGCPVDRITGNGAGSAMLCSADRTVELVRSVVEAVSIPVTVKMRLGWDDTQLTAPKFAREFEQAGVAAITIHGRTRAQGFSGSVNRDGIRQVVEAVEKIPVIGNGDIRTLEDADRMFQETGCAGIAIGRGALANPWIFKQLVHRETTGEEIAPGNFDDRLELMQRQLGYLEGQVGTDLAIRMFRKMGHWYLKSMHVSKSLRHEFQQARTRVEVDAAIERIRKAGPTHGERTGVLPQMHVPVPSGPVERW